jgi:hypothetical protein
VAAQSQKLKKSKKYQSCSMSASLTVKSVTGRSQYLTKTVLSVADTRRGVRTGQEAPE